MHHDTGALLAPVSLDNPAGNNLEYELIFDDIRQARESDDDYLNRGDWAACEPRKADWNKVRTLTEQALTTQSKDLQLACWFTEAQCHLHGLSGLLVGIEFLSEFMTRFWYQCWPELEDDGLVLRRSKLIRLDRDLSQQLTLQPMLRQSSTTLTHWRRVLAFEHKAATASSPLEELIQEEGDLSMETFNKQAAHFSSIDISQQAATVESLFNALDQLEARYFALSQDPDSDVFRLTRQTLSHLSDYLQRLTQRAIPLASDTLPLNSMFESNNESAMADLSALDAPQIMNRDLAIKQMLAIASYFRETEPSSPVPFLMERAARWAGMTLTEWLDEMINDQSSIQEINNVLTGQSR